MKRQAIAALAALALLSACSADAEPEAKPAPSSPPSAMASASSPPPPSEDPPQTPEDAIRAWVIADSHMQNTGDSTEYLALTTGSCTECNRWAKHISRIYSDGGRAKSLSLSLNDWFLTNSDGEDWYIISVTNSEWMLRTSDSTSFKSQNEGTNNIALRLTEVDSEYRIAAMSLMATAP